MKTIKYIRTQDDEIIVFGAATNHARFRSWYPVSAGVIIFDDDSCTCYGWSRGLGLDSIPEEDSQLATNQFFQNF